MNESLNALHNSKKWKEEEIEEEHELVKDI